MFKYHHVRHFCGKLALSIILLFTFTHAQAHENDKTLIVPHVLCGNAARAIGSVGAISKGQTAAATTASTVAKEGKQHPPAAEPSESNKATTE